MTTTKEVVMYAAFTLDKLVTEYLQFIPGRAPYVSDRLMRASHIMEETPAGVIKAVNDTVAVMKAIEEAGTGDVSGHRMRQKRVEEVGSIMHVAPAYPDKAVKRLKELPTKRLLNA